MTAHPAPRRPLISQALIPLALAGALLAAAAGRTEGADRAITVYMYSEYIDPAIAKNFEARTGIHVTVDVYEAQEEMLAKMRAGGSAQYDVLVASDVVVAPLVALKLVRALDPVLLTHRNNLDPRWRSPVFDPQDQYCVPYQWGTVGLMYRADRVKPPVSWAMVFDPAKSVGPFVLMDEQRSQMAVALRYLGKPLNSRAPQEVAAAGKLLASAKASPDCLGFDGGVAGKNKVLSGEAALAVVYNGDAVKAMSEAKDVAFAVPSEGTMVSMDNMLVCAGSHDPQAAEAFIDEILDARVGAQLSNFTHYATPNKAALEFILPADRANPAIYPPPAVWPTLASLTDLGSDQRLYDEVWTAVKARAERAQSPCPSLQPQCPWSRSSRRAQSDSEARMVFEFTPPDASRYAQAASDFARDGFLHARGLISAHELALLRAASERVMAPATAWRMTTWTTCTARWKADRPCSIASTRWRRRIPPSSHSMRTSASCRWRAALFDGEGPRRGAGDGGQAARLRRGGELAPRPWVQPAAVWHQLRHLSRRRRRREWHAPRRARRAIAAAPSPTSTRRWTPTASRCPAPSRCRRARATSSSIRRMCFMAPRRSRPGAIAASSTSASARSASGLAPDRGLDDAWIRAMTRIHAHAARVRCAGPLGRSEGADAWVPSNPAHCAGLMPGDYVELRIGGHNTPARGPVLEFEDDSVIDAGEVAARAR